MFVVEYLRQVKHYQKIFVVGHLYRSELSEYLWWDFWGRLQFFKTLLVYSRL
jgi:hypothetical protein